MFSCCLCSYSVFSLQRLDAVCFIAAVLANNLDAVIEASKLELFMQLDCKLVDLYVGWGLSGKHTLHLQHDWSAEGLAFGATEGKSNLILFVVISNNVGCHAERNCYSSGALSFDFLLNRNTKDVNWELIAWLIIGKGQSAASFPWPVSVIEHVDFDNLSHARSDLKALLRFALADGTGLFPAMLSVEVLPLVIAPLHLLLPFLGVLLGPFTPLTHLGLELLHHLVHWRATGSMASTTTATTATTTASAASAAIKASQKLVDELHRVIRGLLAFFLIIGWCNLVKHGNHDVWSSAVLTDLEESMFVAETLFTGSTVIEVLANGALVAKALNGVDATAIASDIGVHDSGLLLSLLDRWQVIGLKKLLEDVLRLLLQLVVYEVLKGLPWDALDLVLLAFFVADLLVFLFHLFICGDRGSRAESRGVEARRLDTEDELIGR